MEYVKDVFWGKNPEDASPEIDSDGAEIRMTARNLDYSDGWVTFNVYCTFNLPASVASRYQRIGEAFVLIVNDVDQRDTFAMRTSNDFIRYADRQGTNLITRPPMPLIPVEETADEDAFEGGWIDGEISFSAPAPKSSPGIYLYFVLENYISNVVAIDLVKEKIFE